MKVLTLIFYLFGFGGFPSEIISVQTTPLIEAVRTPSGMLVASPAEDQLMVCRRHARERAYAIFEDTGLMVKAVCSITMEHPA